MMIFNLLITLISFAYFIRTIRNNLYMVFLWQLKEYRIDRMLAHINSPIGKKLIINPVSITKTILFVILLFLFPLLATSQSIQLLTVSYVIFGVSIVLFWFIWLLEALYNLKELFSKGWLIPKLTFKAVLILSILIVIQLFYIGSGNISLQLLIWGIIIDRLFNPILALVVTAANLPSSVYKKLIITKARNIIRNYKNIKIIGITGSFGKTSTKDFLSQILSAKYEIFTTEGSINTEIGISSSIINKLKVNKDILIAEMGAYRKGEIKAMCKITPPQIGIITGINEQHLQLFGSMENLIKTKYELIENIVPNGVAIFNTGNKYIREMIVWAKNKRKDLSILGYSKEKEVESDMILDVNMVYARNIVISENKIIFNLINKKKVVKCMANLCGKQNVDNILAAVSTSLILGMSLEEIRKGINLLQPPLKTMKKLIGTNNSIFIDDTFNANSDGVSAVLDYMKLFKGKKILVLTPLIELGTEAKTVHNKLSKKSIEICDLILLTNSNYSEIFLSEGASGNAQEKVKVVNTNSAIELIRREANEEGVVVFEGKETEKILKQLTIDLPRRHAGN